MMYVFYLEILITILDLLVKGFAKINTYLKNKIIAKQKLYQVKCDEGGGRWHFEQHGVHNVNQ